VHDCQLEVPFLEGGLSPHEEKKEAKGFPKKTEEAGGIRAAPQPLQKSDGLFFGKKANALMTELSALAALNLPRRGASLLRSCSVSTHLCLRGHRVPPSKMSLMQWQDKAGLAGLFPHQWQLPF
jgi:hypothetical protein